MGAGQLAEPPVDLEGDVLEDGRRVVGEAADIEGGGVGLHVGPVPASGEVKGDVQEVDDFLVRKRRKRRPPPILGKISK